MSHFGSKLFGGLGDLLGESEVAWPFRLCNQAIAKSQTALSATSALIASDKVFTRSRQFLSDVRQIWRADIKLSTQTLEARWHARAGSLRKVLLWMGQSHSHSIMSFEAAGFGCCLIVTTSSCNGNSSYRNLAAGFGERPVQQVLVFSLFFLNEHFV